MPSDTTVSDSRRRFIKAVGAGAVLTGTAGCAGSIGGGGSGYPATLGAAFGLSGELAKYGGYGKDQAVKHALPSYINTDEELLEVVFEDTQTSPQTGVSAAQKLVNEEGVKQLWAGMSSGVAMAIAESVAIPNDIFMSTSGTSSKISELNDDGYVWRAAPPSQFQARALATLVMNNDVNSVSVIYVNNDFGTAIADEFAKSYKKIGGSVKSMNAYEQGKSSYRTQLNAAMKGDPEGLVFVTYPKAFTVMAREAFEMGIKDQVEGYFAPETIKGADVQENLPAKTINGMKGTQPSPPETDAYERFKNHSKEVVGRQPVIWEGYYFDTVMLHGATTVAAIDRAGEYSSKTLRDQLYKVSNPPGTKYNFWEFQDLVSALRNGDQVNYQGATGTVNVTEAGDVPGTYKRWEVVNGEFKTGGFIDIPEELGG